MRSKTLLYLIVLIQLFSCSKPKEYETSNLIEIEIDLDQTVDYKFTDFFDTTLIVPLEETENSFLGEVSKVISKEDVIFVLDSRISETLYLFDYSGKLINSFSGTGSGPGEFLRATNFYLSKNADTVFIQDSSMPKVLAFKKNGEFLFEKNLRGQSNFDDLIPYGNGYLMISSSSDNLGKDISILDSSLEFVTSPFEFRENEYLLESGGKDQFFYPASGGGLFLKESFSKDLYLLESGNLKTYSLEFPENRVYSPPKLPWDDSKPSVHQAIVFRSIKKDDLLNIGDQVLNLGDIVFVNYVKKDRIYCLALDQSTQEAKLVSNFINDLDGVVANLPAIFPINYQADQMTISLTPTQILSEIEGEMGANPYQDYLLAKLQSQEENPVLFIYKKTD